MENFIAPKKRVLILSMGIGGGHNSAANALEEWASKEFGYHVETKWIDVLKHTGPIFRLAYCQPYFWMINHFPSLYRVLYEKSEQPGPKRGQGIRNFFNQKGFPKVINEITKYRPDAVICTHFKAANIVTAALPDLPCYSVVTDYDAHNFWINSQVKGFFVANKEVKHILQKGGIPTEKIHMTGIPIRPVFHESMARIKVREIYGIPMDKKVILCMGGALGSQHTTEAITEITRHPEDFVCLVLTGKNEKLVQSIQEKFAHDPRVKTMGYVRQMSHVMDLADFAVTKAGGLTITEALARKLPLVIFRPIPGQEERNAHYLMEKGAATLASSPEHLHFKVGELLQQPEKILRMARAERELQTPQSAPQIWRKVLGLHQIKNHKTTVRIKNNLTPKTKTRSDWI